MIHTMQGFHLLTEELGDYYSKEQLHPALHRMLPVSPDERGDDVRSMADEYHKYKREYVKHLFFNPDSDNLSKCHLTLTSLICCQLQTGHW